mmetsp:Transcript_16655/g.32285  ORF Transcript_16655/g.32285 Transcript_16655/m.32285 type:complete len:228 (-) Transcript_16655:539-1222(-)
MLTSCSLLFCLFLLLSLQLALRLWRLEGRLSSGKGPCSKQRKMSEDPSCITWRSSVPFGRPTPQVLRLFRRRSSTSSASNKLCDFMYTAGLSTSVSSALKFIASKSNALLSPHSVSQMSLHGLDGDGSVASILLKHMPPISNSKLLDSTLITAIVLDVRLMTRHRYCLSATKTHALSTPACRPYLLLNKHCPRSNSHQQTVPLASTLTRTRSPSSSTTHKPLTVRPS